MVRLYSLATMAMFLGLAGVPAGAMAGVITETFVFSGSGYGAGAPFPSVSGQVTVSFDPAVDQIGTPLPSFTSTLPASYAPFVFNYRSNDGQIVIGDSCQGFSCSLQGGTDEAVLGFFVTPAGLPTGSHVVLSYTSAGSQINFVPTTATVTLATRTAVPEPAPIAALAVGMIGLMSARRRRG